MHIDIVYKTKLGIFYHADAIHVLKILKQKPKLIVTDPPYLINYSQWEKNYRAVTGDNPKNKKIVDILLSYAEKLREDGALYCFCSWKTIDIWKPEIDSVIPVKNVIIWSKNNWTMGDLGGQYAQKYEMIIYAPKPKHKLYGKRETDIWEFKRVSPPRLHPAQKPEEIIEMILLKSTKKGDLVVDPFAGSGTVAVVAERMGRRWFCVDIDEKACNIAKTRLSQGQLNLFLK